MATNAETVGDLRRQLQARDATIARMEKKALTVLTLVMASVAKHMMTPDDLSRCIAEIQRALAERQP